MYFIIGEKKSDKIIIDSVTEDPISYAYQFEPIDMINGLQYAWDSNGNRFIFTTDTDYDTKRVADRAITIVDVGSWKSGSPVLKNDGTDSLDALAPAISDYVVSRGSYVDDISDLSYIDLLSIAAAG